MTSIKLCSNRMEELLQYYEEQIWLISTVLPYSHHGSSLLGKVPNPMLLRQSLEKGEPNQIIQQLVDLVNLSKLAPELSGFVTLRLIVRCIIEWVFGSRRMYSVSESLINMLLETDLPNFLPSETKIIAPTFAIILDKPIMLRDGRLYDFLVVSSSGSDAGHGIREFLTVTAFTRQYSAREKYSLSEKKSMVKSLKNNPLLYTKILDKSLRKNRGCYFVGFSINPEDVYRPYNEFITESGNNDDKILFQIGMGLNLYLQSARQGDVEKKSRIVSPVASHGKSIVDGAELFSLNVSKAFSRPSSSDGDGSGNEVRPHFRRGFWRRPKGCGQNPNAIATEWVRPTWVNKERIAKGEHPVGAMQKV